MAHPSASARVWLVTGCSSGFGRHLVSAIIARGDKVIATARRISDLDYIAEIDPTHEQALAITLDVTDPFDQVRDAVDKAIAHFGSIDVLVNNAGFVVSGVWEELRCGVSSIPSFPRNANQVIPTKATRRPAANLTPIFLAQ
jgi:NAD(P)-dependent dehydrogenase (short-subunit alcohol dehydrogenase family)